MSGMEAAGRLASHGRATRLAASAAVPGLLVAAVVATAAAFLAEHYGAPVMLMALLLGMALGFLGDDPRCQPGIDLAARRLLRIGIALLGARVTLGQFASLGPGPLLTVPLLVAATIGLGVLGAAAAGRDWTLGVLTGGAVAICGASAALAIAAVLPPGGAATTRSWRRSSP